MGFRGLGFRGLGFRVAISIVGLEGSELGTCLLDVHLRCTVYSGTDTRKKKENAPTDGAMKYPEPRTLTFIGFSDALNPKPPQESTTVDDINPALP